MSSPPNPADSPIPPCVANRYWAAWDCVAYSLLLTVLLIALCAAYSYYVRPANPAPRIAVGLLLFSVGIEFGILLARASGQLPARVPVPDADGEWYCSWDDSIRGPFTSAQLRLLIDVGRLTAGDQVRAGATSVWSPAGDVVGHLFQPPEITGATPAAHLKSAGADSSMRIYWFLLSCVALAGGFLLGGSLGDYFYLERFPRPYHNTWDWKLSDDEQWFTRWRAAQVTGAALTSVACWFAVRRVARLCRVDYL